MNLETIIQQRKQKRNYRSETNLIALDSVSGLLSSAQAKSDLKAFKLVQRFHEDPDAVMTALKSTSANTCLKLLLALNNELCIAKDLPGTLSYGEQTAMSTAFKNGCDEQFKAYIETHLKEHLKNRIDNCLKLTCVGGAPDTVNKPIRCDDGRYRNSRVRSAYNQLYGTALSQGLSLSSMTVHLSPEFDGPRVTNEITQKVKKKLVYRLEREFPDKAFAGMFLFEVSKKNHTFHIHGLIVYPKGGKARVSSALKPISAGKRNSIYLTERHERKRCATLSEVTHQIETNGNIASFELSDCSAITIGAADYLSKDLLKSLGYAGKQSRIASYTTSAVPSISLSQYHKARTALLEYIAITVANEWNMFDQDSILDRLLSEPGALSDIFRIYTTPADELIELLTQ